MHILSRQEVSKADKEIISGLYSRPFGLYIAHCFIPPTPGPIAAANTLKAKYMSWLQRTVKAIVIICSSDYNGSVINTVRLKRDRKSGGRLMAKQISIGGLQIAVSKKKIKNLYLSVYPPDGRVRVAAPLTMNDEAIRAFVVSKLAWIRKQQIKLTRQERLQEREYVSGESHYFMGQRYWLNVITTKKKQRVELGKNNQLALYIRSGSTAEQRRKVITEWYRSELKKQLPDLIAKWEKKIGVHVNSWGVKQMKTRWGSCNPKAGRIWVNLELAKKSPQCLEYIIVHEMLHLLEKYHNKRFYAYLGQFMPNWKEIRAELNG